MKLNKLTISLKLNKKLLIKRSRTMFKLTKVEWRNTKRKWL